MDRLGVAGPGTATVGGPELRRLTTLRLDVTQDDLDVVLHSVDHHFDISEREDNVLICGVQPQDRLLLALLPAQVADIGFLNIVPLGVKADVALDRPVAESDPHGRVHGHSSAEGWFRASNRVS